MRDADVTGCLAKRSVINEIHLVKSQGIYGVIDKLYCVYSDMVVYEYTCNTSGVEFYKKQA